MSDAGAGVAYVQLVPSMRGFSNEVTKGLGKNLERPLRQAGDTGGKSLAGGISSGMDGARSKLNKAVGRIGDLLKTGLKVAGAAAGVLLVAGIKGAMDEEVGVDKLVAQLGGSEWAGEMGEIAGRLYRDAFGDSISDTGEALRQVLQSPLVAEDDSAQRIEDVTAKALTFTDVMNKDLERSIRATSTLMRTGLARDADHAFDLLTRGIQQGGDQADDLLDTLIEYPVQFQALGLSAEDSIGLLLQGLKAGARDTDTVADALKEFSIRGKDASKASAEGFALIGLSAEEMTRKVAAGGPEAREALDMVVKGLADLEDPAQRDAAAVALFGTKSEDLQKALGALDLDTAAAGMGDVEGATDQLGSAYDNASTKIESFKRKALHRLAEFIGNTVIPLLERFAGWVQPIFDNIVEHVGPVITEIVDGFTTLKAAWEEGDDFGASGITGVMADIGVILNELQPYIDDFVDGFGQMVRLIVDNEPLMIGALTGIAIVIGALLIPALWGMAAPIIAAVAPFLLIAILAAAIAAGLVWLYENVEEFRDIVDEALPLVAEIFSDAMTLIQTAVEDAIAIIQEIWERWGDDIIEVVSIAWDTISGIFLGALEMIQGQIRFWTAILRGDWSGAWAALGQILDGAMQIILAILSGALRLMWVTVRTTFTAIHQAVQASLSATRTFIKNRLDDIAGFFLSLPGRLARALAPLGRLLSAPFRAAFGAIQRAWNSTVGGFRVSIPGFLGFGGVSFGIPRMHTGGIVPGFGDQLILAKGGEGVFTEDQMAAIGAGPGPGADTRLIISADGEGAYLRWIKSIVRIEGGGDVNVAFGGT